MLLLNDQFSKKEETSKKEQVRVASPEKSKDTNRKKEETNRPKTSQVADKKYIFITIDNNPASKGQKILKEKIPKSKRRI